MNANDYSQKRDELTNILSKVIEIKELNQEKKTEFEQIRKKCLEDQFNIVLVGEFQGGKSTTFNTFCDGREISPRGAMVKTSACRLTARNISDSNDGEFAIVYWKTNKDLILNIEEVLSKHIDLKKDLGVEFKPGDETFGLSDKLSFANKTHVHLIGSAITKEWENYEKNKREYSSENLDILRIATLIVRFANAGVEKHKKDRYSINDISKLIVFPSSWETKWRSGANAHFELDEALFAFIGGIDCFIHSPNLARLGCSITDCPGLFASKWDTQVAIETIPKSDAIIYLLGGSKAMGIPETKALREIQKMPAAHKKIFFAINMKESRHVIDNSIVPTDVAIIDNIGFSVDEEDVKRYHALLAFLAEFGNSYLNVEVSNEIKKSSKIIFADMAKRMVGRDQPIEDSWVSFANQSINTMMIPSQTIQNLDNESVQKIRELSGFVELFDGVERFIVKNKAYSILVTNGTEKASFALTEIENTLKNREQDVTDNVAHRQAELEKAKIILEEFQKEAYSIIENSFNDDIYDKLINNFYDEVILASTDEICLKVAYKLNQKITASLGWAMIWKKEEGRTKLMEDICRPIYTEVMDEVLGNRADVWLGSIVKGENESYLKSIYRETLRVKKELEENWKNLSTIEFNFTPIDYPNILMVFENVKGRASSDLKLDNQLKILYKTAINNLILSGIVLIIGVPIMGIKRLWQEISSEILGNVGEDKLDIEDEIQGLVGSNLISGERTYPPVSSSELPFPADKLYNDIKAGLSMTFLDNEIKQNTYANILLYLKQIGNIFKDKCIISLEDQKSKFDKDHTDSKARLETSLDERRSVANEAKALRESQIQPRNNEIKSLEDSIKKIDSIKKNLGTE